LGPRRAKTAPRELAHGWERCRRFSKFEDLAGTAGKEFAKTAEDSTPGGDRICEVPQSRAWSFEKGSVVPLARLLKWMNGLLAEKPISSGRANRRWQATT